MKDENEAALPLKYKAKSSLLYAGHMSISN